jgi:hypothetical protein
LLLRLADSLLVRVLLQVILVPLALLEDMVVSYHQAFDPDPDPDLQVLGFHLCRADQCPVLAACPCLFKVLLLQALVVVLTKGLLQVRDQ